MPELKPQGGSGRVAGRSHEHRDLSVTRVIISLFLLAALIVAVLFLIRALIARWGTVPGPHLQARPSPALDPNPGRDLEALRRWEDRMLGTYGWVDRREKTVHVPIEVALERVLRRGLPVRSQARSSP